MKEFAMFPNPVEQNRLRNMTAEELVAAFTRQADGEPDLGIAAVYDVLFALDDKEKATVMLQGFRQSFGEEIVAQRAAEQVEFRIFRDNQKREDQKEFVDLCNEIGLSLPKIKAGGKG